MAEAKSFEISKWDVVRAFELVKANQGAGGVDGQSIEEFEGDLAASGAIARPAVARGVDECLGDLQIVSIDLGPIAAQTRRAQTQGAGGEIGDALGTADQERLARWLVT